MVKVVDSRKIILLDADIMFHFLFADELGKLQSIFPSKHLHIPDIVYNELTVSPRYQTQIDNLFLYGYAKKMDFPEDNEIKKTYGILRKEGKGKGESACMAIAKHKGYEIGSSNWGDIYDFCTNNDITHYSTLDFLYTACCNSIMTERECEYFISAVRGKKGRIKFSMKEYIDMIKKGHRDDLYATIKKIGMTA